MSCSDHENLITSRDKREIVVSWGDDSAVRTNMNQDADQFIEGVTQKSRRDLRAAEQAKELLGKLPEQIVESKHPSQKRENDQE